MARGSGGRPHAVGAVDRVREAAASGWLRPREAAASGGPRIPADWTA
ncbi:hypothetical protein [Kyrpidia sp.]|nr:hypothetical protein [Kyrpidia sp.]MCL6577111.1 hypothetical protein [Kyrpidia sp.]